MKTDIQAIYRHAGAFARPCPLLFLFPVLAELARDGQTSTPIDAFSLARFDEPLVPAAHNTPTTPVQAH